MTSGFVREARVQTARLRLQVLHATPQTPQGRVLLLGGSNFDLRLKRQFLTTDLAARFEIVTFEPRGIGRSDQPAGTWNMADYALDALSLLDALGWPNAYVLGESFGGMTALHLALLAPARVAALALASATAGGAGGASFDISTFLDMPRAQAAEAALVLQDRANGDLRRDDPAEFAHRLADRIAFETRFADPSVSSGGYARLLAARAAHDVWDRLPEIAQPTLVLSGMRDDQAPLSAQQRMAGRLCNATQLTYDAGHGLAFANHEPMAALGEIWGNARQKGECYV